MHLPRRASLAPGAVVGAVLGMVLVAVLAGCRSSEDEPAPRPAPTRIADLDASATDLVRAPFCDLVPDVAVRDALRGAPAGALEGTAGLAWGNDDEIPPIDGTRAEVSHEFGCSWRAGRYAARAWVFARPVTAAFAAELIPTARERAGCTARRGTFGSPGLTQVCTLDAGRVRVRHAGLFGDTWITCEVSGPRGTASPRARADAWCARVTHALDARD